MANGQKKEQEKGLYTCTSCGASFRADLPNCPYCGTANPKSAENAYMLKMRGINNRMSRVPQQTTKAVGEEIHESTHLLRITATVIGIIVAIFLVIVGIFHFTESRRSEAEYKWSLQGFSEMNEAYDAGDYDKMLDLYMQALNDGHDVYDWKHEEFAERLLAVAVIEDLLDQEKKGETLYQNDYRTLFRKEEELANADAESDLSSGDKAYIKEYAKACIEDYYSRFPMTDKQKRLIAKDNKEYGVLTTETIDAYLKPYFEEHNIPEK